MTHSTRRDFLRGSAAAVAAVQLRDAQFASPLASPRWRPNDELRIACVGLRGRGGDHIRGFARLDGVRVTALCDVDADVLASAAKKFADQGQQVDTFADVRAVLDRKDIDAISIATPNHWHALMAIWACQAGKDVYVEKPVSHNIWEGGQIVAAARKHQRIVQTGTQSRSSHAIAAAIAWLQAGNLGKIQAAHALCYKPRQSIGKMSGPQTVPSTIDYDLWCGPAPKVPLRRKSLHYDWHWDFVTGNGDLGNQGIHQMDIARWALGEQDLPPRVLGIGGRFGYDDDADTPNTMIACLDYARAPLVFEVRGLPKDKASQGNNWSRSMDDYHGAGIGVVVHCEGGLVRFPDYASAIAFDRAGKEVQRWKGATDHYANFVAAVRSRKHEDLTADIRQGHVSSAMCHMGNVSYLLGEQGSSDDAAASVAERPAAAQALTRMVTHLQRNEIDLGKTPLRCGPWLTMNPQDERFADDAANRLARREYRQGFVVPSEV